MPDSNIANMTNKSNITNKKRSNLEHYFPALIVSPVLFTLS